MTEEQSDRDWTLDVLSHAVDKLHEARIDNAHLRQVNTQLRIKNERFLAEVNRLTAEMVVLKGAAK